MLHCTAGVDVHESDSLGLMALTDAGVAARDRFVFSTCAAAGVRGSAEQKAPREGEQARVAACL